MKPDCPECGGPLDVFVYRGDWSIDCIDCGEIIEIVQR